MSRAAGPPRIRDLIVGYQKWLSITLLLIPMHGGDTCTVSMHHGYIGHRHRASRHNSHPDLIKIRQSRVRRSRVSTPRQTPTRATAPPLQAASPSGVAMRVR